MINLETLKTRHFFCIHISHESTQSLCMVSSTSTILLPTFAIPSIVCCVNSSHPNKKRTWFYRLISSPSHLDGLSSLCAKTRTTSHHPIVLFPNNPKTPLKCSLMSGLSRMHANSSSSDASRHDPTCSWRDCYADSMHQPHGRFLSADVPEDEVVVRSRMIRPSSTSSHA